MRTGLPNDFSKLKRVQPGPRCFGSVMIQPLQMGAGNPMETASNLQSRNRGLSSLTISRGVIAGPDLNFRRWAREIITFTFEPPISITTIFFFTYVSDFVIPSAPLSFATAIGTRRSARAFFVEP